MASNFIFDNSLFSHSSPENFYSDPFSSFYTTTTPIIDVLQNPIDHIFSSSPPSNLLENLSLYHESTQFQNYANFTGFEVKTEDQQLSYINDESQSFLTLSEEADENVTNKFIMQRSYSSNCFETQPGFLFQHSGFGAVMESQSQAVMSSSPESNFGYMRRVCSTGDLQNNNIRRGHASDKRSVSTESEEAAGTAAGDVKVRRYSAEERKERIAKYKAKRTQRNFNKTIKYACRKTLADNRPRIRGRFARNDDNIVDIPKAVACSTTTIDDQEEDELWVLEHQEEEDRTIFQSSFSYHDRQYFGF
ncbi:hypothetical protein ACFE04_015153 [Oxalis oulophora]